jgi:soluble cytochrome b562
MTEEQNPNVDEIKDRLKIEVEDLDEAAGGAEETAAKPEKGDIVDEMKSLGRQVGETIRTAWESDERQKFEGDLRAGMRSFADEIDKVVREVREGEAGKKVKAEAEELRTKVETADLGTKTRTGIVQGLRWLSEELGKLAEQFTPKEKEPAEETVADVSAETPEEGAV